MADITVYKGDSKTLTITVKDSDGDAQNLTGYTVYLTVKKKDSDADSTALINKAFTNLSQSLYPGQAQLTLSTTDTNITARQYVFDIELNNSGSPSLIRKTLVKGTFEVIQDVYHHD